MTVVCTLDELAEALGVTKQAVGELCRGGTVVRIEPGKYDLTASCRNYIASLRRNAEMPNLTAARVRLAESKAALAEIERQKAVGDVVTVAEVEATWSALVARFRTRMLALPSKVAASVRMASTTVEVAAIIRAEVHLALQELSQAGSGNRSGGVKSLRAVARGERNGHGRCIGRAAGWPLSGHHRHAA